MKTPRQRIRLKDLARLAGVSVATVSRALHDHPAVNAETKRRVWTIARENDYAFRTDMPKTITGSVATIMIVIPAPQGREGSIADPFYLELIGGVGVAARENRCDLLISHIEPHSFEDLDRLMLENRADGVIFLGQSLLHDRFNRLAKEEDRFVVWGADLPDQRYCSIGSDNLRGGKRAAAHLFRMGRRRIAFLGDVDACEVFQRRRGYEEAHRDADIEVDPSLFVNVRFEVESAEAAVSALLIRDIAFDGIVAANDLIAAGAIRALTKAGRVVPDDVSVVGYDNISLAQYNRPALTTVSQDISKAGRIMVSKLLSVADHRPMTSERLPTDLIVRESCGA